MRQSTQCTLGLSLHLGGCLNLSLTGSMEYGRRRPIQKAAAREEGNVNKVFFQLLELVNCRVESSGQYPPLCCLFKEKLEMDHIPVMYALVCSLHLFISKNEIYLQLLPGGLL